MTLERSGMKMTKLYDATETQRKDAIDAVNILQPTQNDFQMVKDMRALYPEIFKAGETAAMMAMLAQMVNKDIDKDTAVDRVALPFALVVKLMHDANVAGKIDI